MRKLILAFCLCACSGGGDDSGDDDDDGVDAAPMGTTLSHDFPTQTLEPGFEQSGLCQSWTLDNPEELWVNQVVVTNDGGYHHSNWFWVPDDQFTMPDGT